MSALNNVITSVRREGRDYALDIQFGSGEKVLSSESILFKRQNGKSRVITLDIASINAEAKSKINELRKTVFGADDFKEIEMACKIGQELYSQSKQIVLVIDIRNSSSAPLKYGKVAEVNGLQPIKAAENAVKDFLQQSKAGPSKQTIESVRQLIQEQVKPVFMITEGSLKQNLLSSFTSEEQCYLQSKQGSASFCQITEFFMNALKFQDRAFFNPRGNPAEVILPEFVQPIKSEVPFQPSDASVVVYPPSYHDMALSGDVYTKSMKASSVFDTIVREYSENKEYVVSTVTRQ